MNDEQFEGRMQIVEVEVSQLMANQLRVRDTAQREALALARAERDRVIALLKKHDTAQAQLAEARELMRETERVLRIGDGYGWEDRLANNLSAFLARHAQGAQAGDERAAFESWFTEKAKTLPLLRGESVLRYHKGEGQYVSDWALFGHMVWQARAALATQPVVPVAEHPVVKALLEVAAAAHLALEGTDSDGVDSTWDEADRASLEAAIEVLDRLPDDQPGFTMEPAAKAAWALRNLNAVRGAGQ